ncbi:MAG: RNA methyltransferase [Marinilabiliales bacterium]|nr:MAG: RNA methyltransferase [Marinilabiliales bacterium]
MKKLKLHELERIGIEEYKQRDKLPIVIVLDNIRSLNNIGSFFRTADGFRVERIILCGLTATPPHKDIHKTALGATDSVEWEYCDKTEYAVAGLKKDGYVLAAIEQCDDSIYLDKFVISQENKYALIFGHEVKGVSQQVIDLCDLAIEIPQYGTKHSFNVSVSAGILMWEFSKQYKQ